ncbi:response regulator [Rhizobium sp. LEGMi198b]|uniref:response regulator n=1 Tax=unclassified Rhizobium TaxID=2613769 RepID=UPI000CDF3F28|nr:MULTISPECIES: response regulator [Rhizobium]AVA24966.1 response regulator protein [Rhizobium sp. NXC24]MDK4741431.1 response regulator [Rhizobium sp. CNPSo 3464]UWU24746.1 response regulator [Rhizobium tropici]WFU05816.1 response regulator [Rhizobium sp. CB3171]
MSNDTILIVEDDFFIAMDVEATLTAAGYSLAGIASSAEEAIRLAVARRPALAIMDIRLSGKRDGVDAALELFRDHGIRCIFATAHADHDIIQRAGPACPLAWLQKPYSMPSLISAVQKALSEIASKSDDQEPG